MTDSEINEAVARKLGYRKIWDGASVTENQAGWASPGYSGKPDFHGQWMLEPPDFCHSIAAAWEIVERYRHIDTVSRQPAAGPPWNRIIHFFLRDAMDGFIAGWWQSSMGECICSYEAKHISAPMAICLAFLNLP